MREVDAKKHFCPMTFGQVPPNRCRGSKCAWWDADASIISGEPSGTGNCAVLSAALRLWSIAYKD